MGTMDKLAKALEALKVIQPPNIAEDGALKKKDLLCSPKEIVIHCSTVVDAICSPSLRATPDFPKMLSLSMETFMTYCNDENSNVRLMADECLNRTIKTLLDSQLGRLLVELFKEIKKDGPPRTLRAALSRFGDICHLMRPAKCRPYTVNMIPALAKICQRKDEENVQETLSTAITKIMPVLGQFTNDKDIKTLLKAFLPNLTVNSAIVRRAAATSLICICQNSRRPSSFYSWILSALFDLILPVQEERPVYVILGVLLCFRHLVPQINETSLTPMFKGNVSIIQNEDDLGVTKEQILKVYEITLYFTHHVDHNVITATLETLYQLLKNSPKSLQQTLVSSSGITKSLIYTADMPKLNRAISESQTSVLPSNLSVDESALEDDQDIYMPDRTDEDSLPYYEENMKNSEHSIESISFDADSEDVSEYSNLKIGTVTDEPFFPSNPPGVHLSGTPKRMPGVLKKGASDENMLDTDDEFWDHSTSTPSPGPTSKIEFKLGNIGMFTDADIPLKYCARLLCSSFLLSGTIGGCIPDKSIRISVKSLALGCLGGVLSLYPKAYFLPLHLTSLESEDSPVQRIYDIILYASHSDPHVRGQVSVVIGHFISHGLQECGGWWSNWVSECNDNEATQLEHLLLILAKVVQDNSSVASKLGLVGLKLCLSSVFNSLNALEAIVLLDTLFKVKDNSYWLAKVELAELVSSLSFKVVHYLESHKAMSRQRAGDRDYQDKFLRECFIPLLGDEDFRVRNAAAASFVKLIPNLFHPGDHQNKDPINAIGREDIDTYLHISHKMSLHSTLPLVHALVKPFSEQNSIRYNSEVEGSLSRVLDLLITTLRMCTNKYLMYGCCHALCLLSEEYLVTVFPDAWNVTFSEWKTIAPSSSETFRQHSQSIGVSGDTTGASTFSETSDLLSHLISLVTSTSLCLDLIAHQHVLQLVGNLLCGAWYKFLLENHKNNGTQQDFQPNVCVMPLVEKIFLHLMRLLNIFTHVLEEQYPIPMSSRPALPSLPNAPSLSPIKRKSKSKDESSIQTSTPVKGSPTRGTDKVENERERSSSKISGNVGQFHVLPLYMKLYEILRSAHASYKISMDFQSSEKFCSLLKCVLDVMSQMLEVSESHDMGKNAEEILCYLKSLMVMEPCSSIQSVRQLLKCLFGTNLIMLSQEAQLIPGLCRKDDSLSRLSSSIPGLYHSIISDPYTDFTHSLANQVLKDVPTDNCDELVSFRCLNWVKRGTDKVSNLLKSGSKGDKANLAAHIRLFEGVVIRALQQYTISSDVVLQCQVLDLLAQLVQLRVNYCLLDADKIFIGYVIKQFEFIEEGQILNADLLIPRIFYFLILLSYERYHSKPIISVPKILQLCDGLIASGQPPDKYVIPALQPVIEDLFLMRSMNKMDLGKELDAQREVVISTLFKLVYFPQVLELFILIIGHSRQDGEDKWKKSSRQVVDVILPLLSRQQIQIENQAQLNILHKLLRTVASNVFRPVDILLKALFSQPKDLNISQNLHRWMCMVLAVMRILISQANEEAVLSRLSDMGIAIKIFKLGYLPNHRCDKEKGENNHKDSLEAFPAITFARFLFQVLGVVVESLCNYVYMPTIKYSENLFLCQQVAHMLLYLMYMFQSGTFRRITAAAMSIIKTDYSYEQEVKSPGFYSLSEIENLFLKLAASYPTIVIQWCNILTLLNCDSRKFWAQLMQPCQELQSGEPGPISMQTSHQKCTFLPCNLEMVRRGGVVLLCDYVCENPNDVIQMTWLIVHHVHDIIDLSLETTVQDFISAIHRNPAASGLLIQAIINARHGELSKPRFMKRALNCLENIHLSQSGKLLSLLVDRYLSTHQLIVARICSNLACKRLEMLLSEPSTCNLVPADIEKLMDKVKSSGFSHRNKKFMLLCEKLKDSLSDAASPSTVHPLLQSPVEIRYALNKEWFLKYVKEQCFNPESPVKECASLLSRLKYEDALSVMICKDFRLPILEQCFSLGAKLMLSSEKYISTRSHDPFFGVVESPGSALYRSAQSTLLQHLTHLMSLLPRTAKYQARLHQLFSEESFWEVVFFLVPATICFLETLQLLPEHSIPTDSLEDIAHLSILCSEAMMWVIQTGKSVSSEMLKLTLHMLDSALKTPDLSSVIGSESHLSWICSAVAATHSLVLYIQKDYDVPSVPFSLQPDNFDTEELVSAHKACYEITQLIGWLEKLKVMKCDIQGYLLTPLISVIKGLARLPLVNSFARTPPILWQLGWSPELGGNFKTNVPPPPGEYLQDRDVLKQYIYRINLLGWISRQQFEETWMALLGVLSATPIDGVDGKEEDQERIKTSCLAVKSITALLLQTLLLPQPGNPQNSLFLNQPRDKPLAFQHTKCGKKLMFVRSPIHTAVQKLLLFERIEEQILNINAERVSSPYLYSLSQVSLEYLTAAAGLIDEDDDDGSTSSNSSPISTNLASIASFQQREQCLAAANLDIHSCLHFLLDLYSQWLCPQACPFTPLMLLTEVAKSVVALSDIFMEKAQFEWMLDTLLEVQRIHPAEDEIIAQYLIFGICKAASVLGIEQDILEKLRKLLELSLKSTYLPTRISTLHGLLYLLEHGEGDDTFPLLSTATEYVLKHLDTNLVKPSSHNEDHTLILWALAFYTVENYQCDTVDAEFSQKIYQISLNICGISEETSNAVYLTVLHGLERLLVAEKLKGKEANLLLKLTVDRIRLGAPICSLAALGLFLSCMYIGKSTNMWSSELVPDSSKVSEKTRSSGKQMDSEFLLVAMERISILFDRIRKGFPFEAEVICEILPSFLMEFFPVQEILNKIITEFLSSQQPHPQFMAKVIFEVFQYLHKQSQEEIIHEWVLLSLSNFMQLSPLCMAIWSLNCFFISATTNYWFQALFPYVNNRMGKMEKEDKILFCIAGVNFRDQLQNDEQREAYISTIQSVALPQTPYEDLFRCL